VSHVFPFISFNMAGIHHKQTHTKVYKNSFWPFVSPVNLEAHSKWLCSTLLLCTYTHPRTQVLRAKELCSCNDKSLRIEIRRRERRLVRLNSKAPVRNYALAGEARSCTETLAQLSRDLPGTLERAPTINSSDL